jgi:hypothetical protein
VIRGISCRQVVAARRIYVKRAGFVLGVLGAVALCPGAASAPTFSYTGGEQTFVVPPGAKAAEIVATGAAGAARSAP